jgi:hypothetical protein
LFTGNPLKEAICGSNYKTQSVFRTFPSISCAGSYADLTGNPEIIQGKDDADGWKKSYIDEHQ